MTTEIADSQRILPSLMRRLRVSNPYLRSTVVKMIGKGSKSVKWVRAKLSESDPRVRANAVEALWGVDSAEARALLKVRFDYPIFLYEAEKVGITATGEPDANELYPNANMPAGMKT